MWWHGAVEVPSTEIQKADTQKLGWEVRPLYQDVLERHFPLELRRTQNGENAGRLPQDTRVSQVKCTPKQNLQVEIFCTKDRAITKEVLILAPLNSARVLLGASVTVNITATDENKDVLLGQRVLFEPGAKSWQAGSGSHCDLIELAILSMSVGETCLVSSSDPSLYTDKELGVKSSCCKSVSYLLTIIHQDDISLPSPKDVLHWAQEEKRISSNLFKAGKLHLALRRYSLILQQLEAGASEISVLETTGNQSPSSTTRASSEGQTASQFVAWSTDDIRQTELLQITLNLNKAACFLLLEKWSSACESCTEVLHKDAHSVKALFRRGQARLKLLELESAHEDFLAASVIDPKNKEVERQQLRCEQLLAARADATQFHQLRRGHSVMAKWD